MARALVTALRPWGRRSGASTITQQVVKRVYGRPYGLFSKLMEIPRAAALERIFTKDEILEQYLNRVPFGDRIQGVERASEEYFGRPANAVTLSQAALLAGVPQAPSVTEPRRHLDRALRRRDYVLAHLAALGHIDEETRARAAAEPPSIRDVPPRPDEAPRFVDAVLARWKDGRLDRRGGPLHTSLDLELQRRADDLLQGAVARFAARGVENGAAVVLANATGEILAYVGAARRGRAAEASISSRTGASARIDAEAGSSASSSSSTGARRPPCSTTSRSPAPARPGASFDARDYDGITSEAPGARPRGAGIVPQPGRARRAAARVGQDVAILARLGALGFHHLSAPGPLRRRRRASAGST